MELPISKELKQWRGELGQKQAADILDVKFKTYQAWELGSRKPTKTSEKQIRRLLTAREFGTVIPMNENFSFMKFQVGYIEIRPRKKPVYGGPKKNTILEWVDSDEKESVFHLVGNGRTLEEAERSAKMRGENWQEIDPKSK